MNFKNLSFFIKFVTKQHISNLFLDILTIKKRRMPQFAASHVLNFNY